jgi:hypothetical protein
MNIQTSELTGAALDWAVAKCEGYIDDCNTWMHEATISEIEEGHYKPSTEWAQGGPIIQREFIGFVIIDRSNFKLWDAVGMGFGRGAPVGRGATPLEAAMRCYIASKLGDAIEIS